MNNMDNDIRKLIDNFSNFSLKESINIKENKTIKLTMLFTDIVDSSSSWKDSPMDMIKAIESHSKRIDSHVKKNNGFICKTIGDAYMVSFKNPKDGIKCGIDIQEDLKNNPIVITKKNILKLRIGICYGKVYEAEIDMQGVKIIDYLGNTVNTAARIEGKVCDVGDIAFAIIEDEINVDDIIGNRKTDEIIFKNSGEDIERSSRILTNIHRHIYKNIKELKGVDSVNVFKIKI